MEKIVTITVNPALDIYTSIGQMEANKKLRCEEPRIEPGGGGVNVSRAISRLGASSMAIFTSGGYTGDMYQGLLENEDIELNPVRIRNNTRQNFAVRETESNDLYRFGTPGARITEEELVEILDEIESLHDVDFIVASGSLPPGAPVDFYAKIARIAKEKKVRFILDTSGEPLSAVLSEDVFLLKPNIDELEELTGCKAGSVEEKKELLDKFIHENKVEVVVLSLGASGALMATRKGVESFPVPSVEKKSSIGAGDSMVAGIVYKLSSGYSIEDAVRYGLACGTAAIITPGTELFHKKDVERLYQMLKANEEKV